MKQRKWHRVGAAVLAVVLAVSLTACGTPQEPSDPTCVVDLEDADGVQGFFNGEVLELRENDFLVRITDSGNCALTVGSEAVVPNQVLSADGCPALTVGRPVRVVFGGQVLETAPLQLCGVFAVYRMDSEGHCISPEGVVDLGPQPYGIALTAEAVTPTGLTLVCARSDEDGEELWTDSLFSVERYEEETNGWAEVPRLERSELPVRCDIAYTVPADDTVEWELTWQDLYGALPAGCYRVVKTIYTGTGNEEAAVCRAGFSIPD